MPKFDDRLAGYVEVKDRIRMFYDAFPDGRLVTAKVKVTDKPDGVPRVWVHAMAFRTADDPAPADGWSWMILPGSTPYTRGSEIENTETSAWGRAIGALGIGIDKSIGSKDEIDGKAGEGQREPVSVGSESVELLGRIAKTGKLVKGTSSQHQGEWRQVETGHAIGFRLKLADRDIPQVIITGSIGEALFLAGEVLLDEQVTVKGHLYSVKSPGRSGYYRLIVGEHPDHDYIETPNVRVPAEDASQGAAPGQMEDDPEPASPEAPSVPLFDEAEEAALEAALPA